MPEKSGIHDHGKTCLQYSARQFKQSGISFSGCLRAIDVPCKQAAAFQLVHPEKTFAFDIGAYAYRTELLQRQLGKQRFARTRQAVRNDQGRPMRFQA